MTTAPGRSVVFVGSTGGAVLSRLLQQPWVLDLVLEVVADRPCGFLGQARSHGLPALQLDAADGAAFSQRLLERFERPEGLLFVSFYTRLFSPALVGHLQGRMLNFHPSLLPAFPGMHGFRDTLASTSRFMGCTVHVVDEGMDSGAILMQAALPLDRRRPEAQNRHRLFLAQVACGLQLLRWWGAGRLQHMAPAGWTLDGEHHDAGPFSPALDDDLLASTGLAAEFAAAGVWSAGTGNADGRHSQMQLEAQKP